MTDIYHITNIKNLSSIIQAGGLYCDTRMRTMGNKHVNIAYGDLKGRRAEKQVCKMIYPRNQVGPGGVVSDYVPFYFAPRSPMLYTINRGNVPGYTEGQEKIVHLVSSVESIVSAGLPYVFTDGHPIKAITEFYDDINDFAYVDWDIMKERYWHNTEEDQDRLRRREAEFLVHQFVPWDMVGIIGTFDAEIKSAVESVLAGVEHQPLVVVRSNWYY